MAPNQTKHISIDVDKALRESGTTVLQLSEATGIARTTLRRKLRKPGTLTLDEAAEIISHLNIPDDEIKVITS